MIADRTQARKDRNWARADEIRAELEALGVQVTDTPTGPTWQLTLTPASRGCAAVPLCTMIRGDSELAP